MPAFAQGDHVADIGILDIEGKVLTAGEHVSLVRWANHNVKTSRGILITESNVANDKLVTWGGAVHLALLADFPTHVWDKAQRPAPGETADTKLSGTVNEQVPVQTLEPKTAPKLTTSTSPTPVPKAAPPALRVSPIDVMDLFKPEVPDDT